MPLKYKSVKKQDAEQATTAAVQPKSSSVGPEKTPKPPPPKNKTPAPTSPAQSSDTSMPEFVWAEKVEDSSLSEPPTVVKGLLHQGSKLVLGGGSKSYKTWCLCDLAISVASGVPWLGIPCSPGVVLYVNFEIQPVFFHKRIAFICRDKGIQKPSNLAIWNLRGHCYDLRMLLPVVKERLDALKSEGRSTSLIILDPVYKSLGGRDENSAGDIGSLLGEIEALAEQTGAAVAFGAHFSKGNQSGKEAIDRISGSGVFARDPDSILTFSKHSSEESFTVDATLRNFPFFKPFVVTWKFPLLRVNDTLDPKDLKKQGNSKTVDDAVVLSLLNPEGMTNKKWEDAVVKADICSRASFFRTKHRLLKNNLVHKEGKQFLPGPSHEETESPPPEPDQS